MIPFPVYKEPTIEVIDDLYILTNIKNGQTIAFDFETTGLKSQAAGQRIICCSVAVSENHVYVFMMPKTPKERQPLINVLKNPEIFKVVQNSKFEHSWSQVRLNVEVQGWIWDTMIMAHILDNRERITSLQFQTYVQFGCIDFKDDTQKYLEADKKDGNAINKIFELLELPGGKEKLLKRNALDSIFEYRLYKQQELQLLPF
jgi:hypothetical protein